MPCNRCSRCGGIGVHDRLAPAYEIRDLGHHARREHLREVSIAAIQGPKARYKGTRKNTFDLRRCSAVANLQVLKAA